MAITVTGKLTKAASQFQAGESQGFGVRIGVKYYDRETHQNEWTNYEAAIFSKNQAQIQFYQQALVEGSVVEITGEQAKIRQFEGQNGLVLSIELLNARLGYIGTAGQPQQQAAPQQQFQQQPQQAAPQQNTFQQNGGYNGQTPQPQAPQQPQYNEPPF